MLGLFVVHLLYLFLVVFKNGKKSISGPDSIIPRLRDLKPALQQVGWMLGLSKYPPLDRWAYWEKFDYWAVFWGMVIIGGTGLILYNPLTTSQYMPGCAMNVAFWVHRIEAILAMGHVFIIHFAIAHLRRLHFPMDKVIFTGRAGLKASKAEKAVWLARLEQEGRLRSVTAGEASMPARSAVTFFQLINFFFYRIPRINTSTIKKQACQQSRSQSSYWKGFPQKQELKKVSLCSAS